MKQTHKYGHLLSLLTVSCLYCNNEGVVDGEKINIYRAKAICQVSSGWMDGLVCSWLQD